MKKPAYPNSEISYTFNSNFDPSSVSKLELTMTLNYAFEIKPLKIMPLKLLCLLSFMSVCSVLLILYT